MMSKRARKVLPLRARAVDLTASTAPERDRVSQADDHIYRVIEIVGTSEHSVEDAIASAIARANSTLRHLRWFEVTRTSGHIADGKVAHYQVTLKLGFTMEGA